MPSAKPVKNQSQALAEDQTEDVALTGAERDPNTDLICAARGGVRHDSIGADGGQSRAGESHDITGPLNNRE